MTSIADIQKRAERFTSPEEDSDVDDAGSNDVGRMHWWSYSKLYFLLFLIFILVSTDVFIDQILGKVDGFVNMGIPTIKGTLVQGGFLVAGFAIADLAISSNLI
jgi:hypothetical protein